MALEDEFENREAFARIYDLPDPAPYFAAMRTLDYRMAAVASGFLKQCAPVLQRCFGKTAPRVLDFACGYGANGAQLTHDISLAEIYEFYGDDARPIPNRSADWGHDAGFYRARRLPRSPFEVGGIDIAGTAVEYAVHVGVLDHGFAVDLTSDARDAAFDAFLADTDVVMESGAIGVTLPAAYDRLLSTATAGRTPWLLIATRPDVDCGPFDAVLERHGLSGERCNPRPFRYRRMMGPVERAAMIRAMTALGNDPAIYLVDDYMMVDLMLYRTAAQAEAAPLADITDRVPPSLYDDPAA